MQVSSHHSRDIAQGRKMRFRAARKSWWMQTCFPSYLLRTLRKIPSVSNLIRPTTSKKFVTWCFDFWMMQRLQF
jgi:hypothetical protein